ncbi:MAG: hypothetical protein CL677_09170 [Bdellovibrionaceae bacterium]|nr:hypothetical protein [Pseudobdellovibrionaceae bacterium]|tara:strand:+ start:37355 stop:38467 length:1113 start_codon:yes stop_codon:yes gene_type:complete
MAQFIAITSRGLEELLFEELTQFGVKRKSTIGGGVKFEGSWKLAYYVVYHSRIATRVLKPILDFSAYNKDDIYNHVKKHDFTKYIEPNQTLRVDTHGTSKIFKDSRTSSLVCKDAVVDQFRDKFDCRPSVDKSQPDLPIMIRLLDEKVSVSIDLVGSSLSNRGYREQTIQAPLREHIASGILQFSGWQPGDTLLDCFCGSGTIPLEASLMSRQKWVHPMKSNFAFSYWKTFNSKDVDPNWFIQEGASDQIDIYGSDISRESLSAARLNSQAAKVNGVKWSAKNALEIKAPRESGYIVTNPPYGHRLKNPEQVYKLMAQWAQHLKSEFKGWTLGVISPDAEFSKQFGMKAEKKFSFKNGDLDCKFLVYKIY